MYSLPPPDMSLEHFDADEDFEIQLLRRFLNELVPFMGDDSVCRDQTLAKWIETLSSRSRLWDEKNNTPGKAKGDALLGIQAKAGAAGGSMITVVPVVRERLAKECLKILFELADSKTKISDASSAVSVRLSVAVIPTLLARSIDCLRKWSKDKPLFGVCPFPRYR